MPRRGAAQCRAGQRRATHINGYMADHGRVVGKADVLGIMVVFLGARGEGFLVDDEGALDVDADGAGAQNGVLDVRLHRGAARARILRNGGYIRDRVQRRHHHHSSRRRRRPKPWLQRRLICYCCCRCRRGRRRLRRGRLRCCCCCPLLCAVQVPQAPAHSFGRDAGIGFGTERTEEGGFGYR